MLLRAGSDMPSLDRIEQEAFPFCRPYGGSDHQILRNYLKKIRMSGPSPGLGTWTTYEKDHRARLTKTFVPKFPLPPDVIPTIVAYAFHTGSY